MKIHDRLYFCRKSGTLIQLLKRKGVNKMKTQSQEIIRYMQEKGSITAFDAVLDLGITQLSSRLVGLENAVTNLISSG